MKKIILITGASSGLGQAIADRLVTRGHRVYGTTRQTGRSGADINWLEMDVTRTPSVDGAVNELIRCEGRIDVLVNNAGMGIGGAAEDFSDEETARQMETNFTGMTRVCRAVLPYMRSNESGLIINIGSVGGLIGLPYQSFYSASKFAMEGFSEALAMEVRPWRIRVVIINPGDFRTKFTANRTLVRRAGSGSAYHRSFQAALQVISHDEEHGCNPSVIARTVDRIIATRHPRYRYIVARFDQKLAVFLRPVLPPAWFRRIIGSHYGV